MEQIDFEKLVDNLINEAANVVACYESGTNYQAREAGKPLFIYP